MNMHYDRNTGVCCRKLIPFKRSWDVKFRWILRTFFNCNPVFWKWSWCLKCCPVFWRDGQTWGQLPVAECHWDRLCFSRRDSTKVTLCLQGVREVLCCSWEAIVTPCPNLLLPIPCTVLEHQSYLWQCYKAGSVWCVALQKLKWCVHMATCGSGLLLPCVWLGKYLLQSGIQIQISPKAEACQDTDL